MPTYFIVTAAVIAAFLVWTMISVMKQYFENGRKGEVSREEFDEQHWDEW